MAMTAADKQRTKEIKERYPFDIKAFVKCAEKTKYGICIAANKDAGMIGVTDGHIGFLCKNIEQTISDLVFLHGADDLDKTKLDYDKFVSLFEKQDSILYHSDMELVKANDCLGFYFSLDDNLLIPVNAGYIDMLQNPLYVEGVKDFHGTEPIVASYPDGTQFIILPVKWMRSPEKYKAVCAYHGIEVKD